MRSKPLVVITSVLILCAVLSVSASASEADRTYIREKLHFFYVPSPNMQGGSVPAAQAINVDDVAAGRGTGDFYTSASFSKHRKLIKALVSAGPVAGAGNLDLLQRVVARSLRMSGLPIGVYIVNDETTQVSTSGNDTIEQYGICTFATNNQGERCWPCALAEVETETRRQWGGSMALPTWAFNHQAQFNRLRSVIGTFVHENIHTQDVSDGRTYMYGVYSYGADGSHYWEEAIPNMSWTYSEGIANFAAYWYDTAEADHVMRWFVNNGDIIIEVARPVDVSADIWLYSIITSGPNAVTPTQTQGGYAYFRFRSLPASAIVHNENVIAIMLYYQARYTSFDEVMGCIGSVNRSTYQVCASAFAQLIESLCREALPEGRTVEQLTQTTYNEPQPYFLPLAVCDYFTSFRSTDQTQFAAVFENMLNNSWIRAYWAQRDNIMRNINRDRPRANDIETIAQNLRISTSP